MAGVVVNAKLLRNQIGHPFTRPKRRFVAQFLGTRQQSARQRFALFGVQQWLASGSARLCQSLFAARAVLFAPAAHGLVDDTQFAANLTVIQPFAHQLQSAHAPRFQSIKVPSHSSRVSHIYKTPQFFNWFRYITRESIERRDPEFEAKMREVLLVYQEVALQNQNGGMIPVLVTVSIDEKPGLQAIANTAPDLPPTPGQHSTIGRDHEYKRLGTCSILAALDLHNGHVIARVERRHRSREFIALLQDLDAYYPADLVIRLILDNHSAHLSKETQVFLASRPNRFQYVLTPKHGSWLNIVETLFGKMARTFLHHIRVNSWEELQHRILKGIEEINAAPVVHRWKKFEALTIN